MAIRLKARDDSVRLRVTDPSGIPLKVSAGVPIYPVPYSGSIDVTPTEEAQTLSTSGYMMTTDITVEPIPSNYGLITWDGTKITVS